MNMGTTIGVRKLSDICGNYDRYMCRGQWSFGTHTGSKRKLRQLPPGRLNRGKNSGKGKFRDDLVGDYYAEVEVEKKEQELAEKAARMQEIDEIRSEIVRLQRLVSEMVTDEEWDELGLEYEFYGEFGRSYPRTARKNRLW